MDTTTTIRTILTGAALAALAACGSDDAASTDADAASGAIAIRAIDHAYLDVPEQIRAGSTLTLTNESSVEAHEIVAVRLPDDETRPAADLIELPPEQFGAFMPGVRTVVLAGPDAEGVAVVGDGTLAEPGRYLLVCIIPTGADPEEYLDAAATSDGPPDVPGGPPHMVQGMFGELTVVG